VRRVKAAPRIERTHQNMRRVEFARPLEEGLGGVIHAHA
jgi:hypothetical protein